MRTAKAQSAAPPGAPGERVLSSEENPWTTLGVSRQYENAWIAVDDHEVRDASGRPGRYGVVRVKEIGVHVLPVDAEGRVTLVGQYRYAARRYSWEVPAGGAKPDADPLAAAKRELREETGIEARHWLELLRLTLAGSITTAEGVCFAAWDLSPAERRLDPQEVIELRRVPFAEAVALALSGGIRDAPSVALILVLQAKADRGELPQRLARLIRDGV